MTKNSILIGIAGGSGSGKSLVSRKLIENIKSRHVVVIEQDAYYHELGNLSPQERALRNFDHPDAIDHELLLSHVRELLAGRAIDQPIYDFAAHTRKKETRHIGGHHFVIVLEGILILDSAPLRELMDIKVFVDTDADIRLLRRILRDVKDRGRSLDSIIEQYENSVRPMHLQFVEPSKRYADVIIPQGGHNTVGIDLLKTKIEALLLERQHLAA